MVSTLRFVTFGAEIPGVRTNEDVSVLQLYELKTVLSPFLCSCAATPILS